MKRFEVRRTIAASPERVWAHLTDGPGLVAGGLGVVRLEGTIAPGASLKVWTGGMPLGLFTGVRQFTLTSSGSGTEFHMHEEFSGVLAPLIGTSIPDLQPSFEQFADGLRALAQETQP